jgi:hypothetical protein
MGVRTPDTCWSVSTRQAVNMTNCCIWLVDSFECMMMHGLANPKFPTVITSWFKQFVDLTAHSQRRLLHIHSERVMKLKIEVVATQWTVRLEGMMNMPKYHYWRLTLVCGVLLRLLIWNQEQFRDSDKSVTGKQIRCVYNKHVSPFIPQPISG